MVPVEESLVLCVCFSFSRRAVRETSFVNGEFAMDAFAASLPRAITHMELSEAPSPQASSCCVFPWDSTLESDFKRTVG